MRAGGKDRGEQHRIGSLSAREAQFGKVMRGGKLHQPGPARGKRARWSVDTIRAPFARCQRTIGKDHQMTGRPRHPPQSAKPRPALGIGEVVMPVDKAARARQAAQCILQHGIVTRIGDEPEVRQGL